MTFLGYSILQSLWYFLSRGASKFQISDFDGILTLVLEKDENNLYKMLNMV